MHCKIQKKKKRIVVAYFIKKVWVYKLEYKLYCATNFHLQNLSCDPVLLASVEGFGVEHDVGAVARLGARDVTLTTQLHPRHSQNRPGQKSSGQ